MSLTRSGRAALGPSLAVLLLAACAACAPATAAVTPEPVPTPTLPAEWDLVILSDSSLMGVGEHYAAYIEEDMGVTVRLHDEWQGSLSAKTLLKQLQDEARLRRIVADAEVVVYFGNPVGTSTGEWACVPRAVYVRDCSPETFSEYRAALEAIVEEILLLRAGAPTIVRATDFYVPVLAQWRKVELEAECTQCLENMTEAVHRAAAAHAVPVAHVYDAFNGPAHDEDPVEKGYIEADGMHTSAAGREAIASLLRELGYRPLPAAGD